jgi:hypothetical protein
MSDQYRLADGPSDSTADGRWMTFTELGQYRGISKASAIKLVRRHGWRRQKDNAGRVRALVPVAWATASDAGKRDSTADDMAGNPKDSTGDHLSRAISVLDAAVATLREQLARENGRVDEEKARAEAAEVGREAERTARAQAEAETEALRVQLDEAKTQVETERLRADQARAEAEKAAQAAARLKEAAELATSQAERAVQKAKALREAEIARAAAALMEPAERPTMVASRIDEVQLRRLQEAEQARKSLGRLARLRLAWRGE